MHLETELRRGTIEWTAMIESFILTFSFESGSKCLGKELQDIQEVIFDNTNPNLECAFPTWDAQMKDNVNC